MATRFHSATVRVNLESVRRAFRRDLLGWYRRHHRKLPWRATRDPYKIWVSEVMLQQTRVEVVRDYYRRWVRTFPTIESLACAPYDRVLKQWEGLGYYQRAKNLHRAAKIVVHSRSRQDLSAVAEWQSYSGLISLPGIGRYTAGAIASIAFGERVPVVDGNVARVLARVFDIRSDTRKSATQERFWALAGALVPRKDPGQFNQAVMELGALVCTPLSPRCDVCPLNAVCLGYARGVAVRLPNRGPRVKPRPIAHNVALVRDGGRVLLRRRPSRGLLASMWELPSLGTRQFRRGRLALALQHTVTNNRIALRVFESQLTRRIGSNGTWRWASRRDMMQLAMPAAHRRALEHLLHQR